MTPGSIGVLVYRFRHCLESLRVKGNVASVVSDDLLHVGDALEELAVAGAGAISGEGETELRSATKYNGQRRYER